MVKRADVFERSVFIPDIHAPYIDEDAFGVAVSFIKSFKPSIIFIMGDVIDFYQLSRFNKNPVRMTELQGDIDQAVAALHRIRQAAPQADIQLLRGNHEHRLTKFLWSKAAELISLRDLTVERLLDLKQLRIRYIEQGSLMFHGFLVKHGNVVRSRSGYTATGEMEKAGISGISGHTHRLSQVYKNNYSGMTTWVEAGCLCSLNPEYAEGQVVDWQQGLAYGFFERDDNRFEIHTAPIIKGRIIYDGRNIRCP
jgi:predicted phosphodiesterase